MLGTSDAWLTSHLSHRLSKPVYHIVDWQIYRPIAAASYAWQSAHSLNTPCRAIWKSCSTHRWRSFANCLTLDDRQRCIRGAMIKRVAKLESLMTIWWPIDVRSGPDSSGPVHMILLVWYSPEGPRFAKSVCSLPFYDQHRDCLLTIFWFLMTILWSPDDQWMTYGGHHDKKRMFTW